MASTRGPVYRCTVCHNCQKPKEDCIWVKRQDEGHQDDDDWCLCGACRVRCREHGIALTNTDPDFRSVAA